MLCKVEWVLTYAKHIKDCVHSKIIDPRSRMGRQPQFKVSDSESRDNSDDAAYWEMYTAIIDEKKEKLWDALVESLEKYRYSCG